MDMKGMADQMGKINEASGLDDQHDELLGRMEKALDEVNIPAGLKAMEDITNFWSMRVGLAVCGFTDKEAGIVLHVLDSYRNVIAEKCPNAVKEEGLVAKISRQEVDESTWRREKKNVHNRTDFTGSRAGASGD